MYFVVGNASNQKAEIKDSPGSTIIQSERDTIINQGLPNQERIQSIVLEGRLTCSIKSSVDIPPPEVNFMMLSDGHAYLEGSLGRYRIEFVSPVRFHLQQDGNLVVINRFALPASSDLIQRPLDILGQFQVLKVPVVTIVYGDLLEKMIVFEVTMTVNGNDIWSYVYDLQDVPFKSGVLFTLPLDTLRERIETHN